jgi:hypothetical protein
MLEYLDKFEKLPVDIQQKASSQEVLLALDDLGARYNVDLTSFFVRVLIKDILYSNLLANIIKEFDLDISQAENLEAELRNRVFSFFKDHLSQGGGEKIAPREGLAALKHSIAVAGEAEKPATRIAIPLPQNNVVAPSPAVVATPQPPIAESVVKPAVIEQTAVPATPIQSSSVEIPAPSNPSLPPAFSTQPKEDKEIADLKKSLAGESGNDAERYSRLAADILEEIGISLPSEGLNLRFKQIIMTFIRGVRTKIEAREAMMKSIVNGGLGLDSSEADRSLAISRKKLEDENKKQPFKQAAPVNKDFVLNKDEINRALGKNPTPAPTEEEYNLAEELRKGNIAQPANIANKMAVKIQRRTVALGAKKAMDDITAPQLMGPVEELGYMDLVTFRRLDPDPISRCRKIEEKVELLGKEGIDRQLEGIKAWRLNPVNKTYLFMGQESILKGKTIDDIILELKEKNLNYLTRAEFEAVMDLNNRLRF